MAEQVSKDLSRKSVVVFDEAHNIGLQVFLSVRYEMLLLKAGERQQVER